MRGTAQKAADSGKSSLIQAPAELDVAIPIRKFQPEGANCVDARRPHQIEVSCFNGSSIISPVQRHAQHGQLGNWSRILGLIGTLAIHWFAISSFGSDLFAHRSQVREADGIGSARVDVHAPSSEELLLLNLDSSETGKSDPAPLAASLAPAVVRPTVEVVSPQPIDLADVPDDEGASSPTIDAGDAATQALMAGRYRSQINARIERAWIRPRTSVDDIKAASQQGNVETPFVCQAQIRQDERGNVQEVLLLQCNGTEAWRHSLVVAINQSSPLPAPPIPAVFAHDIALTFEALPYEAGAPADQYERQPLIAPTVSNTAPAPVSTFDAARRGPDGSPNGNQRVGDP